MFWCYRFLRILCVFSCFFEVEAVCCVTSMLAFLRPIILIITTMLMVVTVVVVVVISPLVVVAADLASWSASGRWGLCSPTNRTPCSGTLTSPGNIFAVNLEFGSSPKFFFDVIPKNRVVSHLSVIGLNGHAPLSSRTRSSLPGYWWSY